MRSFAAEASEQGALAFGRGLFIRQCTIRNVRTSAEKILFTVIGIFMSGLLAIIAFQIG